ncbi:MAG: polysaccharide pyruvyl transferase family protein [Zoogloeaceae bacterium]|nr:polysaccharide pyruvyl transferase family protein [Zoogloeaceae bacterium]
MINAIVLNDTRRNRGHLGCATVMSNIEYLAAKHSIQIVRAYQSIDAHNDPDYTPNLHMADAVILNGEGTFHHDQAEAVELMKAVQKAAAHGKKCYLINCSWENNTRINNNLSLFSAIFTRDNASRREINRLGFDAVTVPDLSLYSPPTDDVRASDFTAAHHVTFLDSVIWKTTKTIAGAAAILGENLYTMNGGFYKQAKYIPIALKLAGHLSRIRIATLDNFHGVVVTGRFHGLCLALKLGLPFLAISSNTTKSESLLSDIGLAPGECQISREALSPRMILRRLEAQEITKTATRIKANEYLADSQTKIEQMFSQLSQLR